MRSQVSNMAELQVLCMLALPRGVLAFSFLVLMTCDLLLCACAAAKPVLVLRVPPAAGGAVVPLIGCHDRGVDSCVGGLAHVLQAQVEGRVSLQLRMNST